MVKFSICETMAAYSWHLRELTDAGHKFGGGADTETLCGLDAQWDIEVQITEHFLANVLCLTCVQEYVASKGS